MIKQPDINNVFRPYILSARVFSREVQKSSEGNLQASKNLITKQQDAVIINIHLSGQRLLQQFGWLIAAGLWGLVFAFLLMR